MIYETTLRMENCKFIEIGDDEISKIFQRIKNDINIDIYSVEIFSRTLKRIHWNAFGKFHKNVKKFNTHEYDDCSPNLTSEQNTDNDLIKLINSFVNCEEIQMYPFANELLTIKLNKLKSLILDGSKSSVKICSISDFAFYECDEIEWINLSENNINYINENVFHFKNEYDK